VFSNSIFTTTFTEFDGQNGYTGRSATTPWLTNVQYLKAGFNATTSFSVYSYWSGSIANLQRGYLFYNTSSIPDDAIITNVTIHFPTITTAYTTLRLYVQNANAGVSLGAYDYYYGNFTGLCANYSWAGGTNAFNISLSQKPINKTGISTFVVRSYYDYLGSTPTPDTTFGLTINSEDAITLNVTYQLFVWINVTDGYFTFGNTSSIGDVTSGYFTFENTASYTSITDGYFTLSNYSLDQTINEGWFTFGNKEWTNITTGYFTFGNLSLLTSISSGYFSFLNTSAYKTQTDGYFTFENDSSWSNLPWEFAEKLYERYTVAPNSQQALYNPIYLAQTLWIGNTGDLETHNITDVTINIRRSGDLTGKTFYVYVRAVDVNGKPTGSNFAIGSIDAQTIGTSSSLMTIPMVQISPFTMQQGTSYALVFYLFGGDATHYVVLGIRTGGTYTGGTFVTGNGGSTWTVQATVDCPFYEYGRRDLATHTDGYFTFRNSASWNNINSGYFTFQNASSFITLNSGWFTLQNGTPTWKQITSGYFSFANTATMHDAVSGYFLFSNASVFTNITTGYFLFSSGVMWDNVTYGWFSFQNSSAVTTITSGYFTLANASSFGNVTTGWFRFSNFPVWQNVRSGWFRFSNVSAWVLLTSGYFTFENVSNATPIVTILLPHTGETKRFDVPFLITYSIYSSKKENVNVSLQVVYQGISGWVNLTNVSMNSNQYWYNSTFDIATIMAALGVHYDYNVPYFLNLSATNILTNLQDDDQSQFRLRDSTFDLIILIFPLVILLLFSILAFWKQSKIILTAAITTAILYATILATQFSGTIDTWFVVMLVVYALALSMMYFFWKKKGTK
jgi:hypothetical protein